MKGYRTGLRVLSACRHLGRKSRLPMMPILFGCGFVAVNRSHLTLAFSFPEVRNPAEEVAIGLFE